MTGILNINPWFDTSGETDDLPAYDTATVDGVEVTGLVINDSDLTSSPQDYDSGDDVSFDIDDEGGTITITVWPYGNESDFYSVNMRVYDGNGYHLGTYESRTCGWENGCEMIIDIDYDFSSSTRNLTSVDGPDVTFDTDQLLIAYGTDSAPDTWPESLETDDIGTAVNSDLQSEYCPSSTATVSVDIENQKFVGDLTGTATVNELSTDSAEEVDVNISPGEVQTIEADIQTPSTPGSNLDIVSIEYGGNTVYTGTTDIIDPSEGIEMDSVSIPDQVNTGETVADNSIVISNTGSCPTDIEVFFDGSSIDSNSINSDEELEFEFDYTAPDVTETESFEYDITVELSGDVISSATSDVEVLGLPDILDINDISISGETVSERTVEATLTVENSGAEDYDVDLLLGGSSLTSDTVRSGSSRDITSDFDLPQVDGTETISLDFEIQSDDITAATQTEEVEVSEEYKFVELTDLRLPSKASSEETIGSRDATAVVESDIDDVYVEISYDGTVVGSSSIRRSGSEEVGIEINMPKVEERSTETIEVSASVDGNTADTISQDIVVTGPASFVSIEFLDAPSEMLSEDVAEVTADISNEWDEEVTVNLEYEEDVVSRNSIRGGSSEDFTFEFEAPSIEGSQDVTLKVTAVVDDVVADESSTTIQVENIASFIEISEISKPNSIFGGEVVDIDAVVANSYEESLDIELEYGGSIVGSSSVRSDSDSTISFEYQSDDVSETTEDEIEILAILDNDVVDIVVETLAIDVATLDIDSTGFPESVCVGNDVDVTVTVSNPTNTSRDALVSVISDEFGTFEENIDGISAGRSSRGTVSFTIPSDASIESETFTIVVERNADKYVEVDSTDFSLTINKPQVSISSVDVPAEANPGEVSGSVTVSNNSQCDIEAELLVSDSTDEVSVRSGDSKDVSVSFDLSTEQEMYSVEVLDTVTGNVQDSKSLTITPVDYLEVDTDSDDVFILTTHSSLEIEGQVVGRNPDVIEEIQSEFDVLPNLSGASFSGELKSSNSEIRIINTDDLRFLNVGVDKDITWVVDGEVEDTSRSFRYSTSGVDGYIPDGELKPRRARTEVSGGLLSGIGIIRYRLGLK